MDFEGHRSGQERGEEFAYQQGPENAARWRAAEREYVNVTVADEAKKRAESLRADLTRKEEQLKALEASLEAIVAQMQKGEQVVTESKSEAARALNEQLAQEAQAEKMKLLAQKDTLGSEIAKIESELKEL